MKKNEKEKEMRQADSELQKCKRQKGSGNAKDIKEKKEAYRALYK